MPTVKELTRYLETIAPLAYQESYDNSGLLVGEPNAKITKALISLECTEAVVQEAISTGCNLVISHHPLIFKGLKKLTGSNEVERTVMLALRNNIALYAIHTNLDSVLHGVSRRMAEKLGLQNLKILDQKLETLTKLVTFTPINHTETVLSALHAAGAGNIGEYSNCSFRVQGKGRFTPSASASPAIGERGKPEEVTEDRIEVIFPTHLKEQVIDGLRAAHPYEEVAYYLTTLQNANQEVGLGMIGELPEPVSEEDFLQAIKKSFNLKVVRHTPLLGRKVQRVAVCGGAGSFLTRKAIAKKADFYITADVKYHEFFDAGNRLVLADIGHYESEIATTELLRQILSEKFTTFAVNLTTITTNPILYT